MTSAAQLRGEQGLAVLAADDNAFLRTLIERVLVAAGHRVRFVMDGPQAVAAAEEAAYDVLLFDLNMPGLDGLAAIGRIREGQGPNAATPALVMSGDSADDIGADPRASGLVGIVSKPLDAADLLYAVAKASGHAARS